MFADLVISTHRPRSLENFRLEHDAMRLLDAAQIGLLVVAEGRVVYANPAYCTMVGWPLDELFGQPQDVAVSPGHRERVAMVVARRLAGKAGRPGHYRALRRDGSSFEARAHAVRVEFNNDLAVLITLADVSDLTAAIEHAQWNAGMLARSEQLCSAGSFEIDAGSGTLKVSAGLRALVGWADDDPPDGTLDTLQFVPPDERALVAGIWRSAVVGEAFEFQHRLQCADGRLLVVLHRGVLHEVADGAPVRRGVAILQDITSQRAAEVRLQEVKNHDEVTGLPNRGCFLDQVDAAMHAARWSDGAFTLMALEVPRIGEVKASMGFGAGDALAMALAARLQAACGAGEPVAHLADCEFAVLFEHDPQLDAAAIRLRAAHLQAELEGPVRLASTDIYSRCVIGLARFPGDGETPADLLEHAQTARLAGATEGGIVFFAAESNKRVLRDMQVEAGLRHAIEADELSLVYQPQLDLSTGKISGVEALLRWTSEALGPVTPNEFIPIAERSGLIGAVGDWVMRRACRQAAAWRRAGSPALRVGVNLSPAQLQRPDLAEHVHALLVETGADPTCLGIEVTESMAMADVDHAAGVLRQIKALGVEISLDDFGTGHSSLSCLRSLPIDVVKVDRSFVHDVTAAPQDVSVTRAIITMAHGLQLRVLVEGVETEGQLALLAANRCDAIQGFWYSPPVPAANIEQMLREGKRLPERYITRTRRSHTLLLVDDEEHIVSALKRLLRRDGYHIVTACGAAEALRCLAENDVDVIISDQRMPGMTGVEFLRRAKDLYPDTVRMVLSGYTELQSIIDAVNEGAIYRFLTKPWDDELLRSHVAEAFRHKDMADENRRLAQQVEVANSDLARMNEQLEAAMSQQSEQSRLISASAGSMRDVLDQLPAAVLGVDLDGMVTFVNREALLLLPEAPRMLGRPVRQALAMPASSGEPADEVRPGLIRLGELTLRVLTRPLMANGDSRGQLLLFVPQEETQGVCA